MYCSKCGKRLVMKYIPADRAVICTEKHGEYNSFIVGERYNHTTGDKQFALVTVCPNKRWYNSHSKIVGSEIHILKTSAQWHEKYKKEQGLKIIDEDGWDRKNFIYSWDGEEITWEEFLLRAGRSTIQGV